ncbi:LysE family translocator [Chromobacterium rhizoryzae]|uniref:LysE family translocator n=1 Tax=Chromobacterium rhizoryzae TaxID=1778675 RepID=UPI001D063E66|nr:LysE family translocator [Chromobacterium rhizoryzae]
MSSQILVMYLLSILVVIAVPGPLSLFMVATSAEHGLLRAWPAFAGGVLASLSLLLLSALGVGALILASPGLFSVLQTLGAGYLLWLGFKTWRGAGRAAAAQGSRKAAPAQWFSHAFLLGISNPKDIAFFVALLPQFINAQAPLAPQLGWMAAGWVAIDLSCKTAYGLLAELFFQRLAVLRLVFLKVSALFFLVLGLALIWGRLAA